MKEIKLTRGQVALVDDEDYEWLSEWKWHAIKVRKTYYAKRTVSIGMKKGVAILMHKIILNNTDPKLLTDHVDRNGLNNQRSNLRLATFGQNNANKTSKINSQSKYLGVGFFKLKGGGIKWVARITKNYRSYNLGHFDKEEDAALAYNKAAIQVHGEFANLNQLT